ncbi:MAG: hypothetical protein H6908_01450 [Hyphomicrobiales bacterium]|nr:hypothetical protein [Rickettsiales bacterium]MCP5361299.1 hypothetical protein [Hyphomicrobiales bacterium]
MVERIGTATFFAQTISDVRSGQSQLAELRRQISSGVKAADFAQLGTETVPIMDLRSSIDSTKQYQRQNELTLTRLDIMETSINKLQELAEGLKSQVALKRSAAGASLDLTIYAESSLDQIKDMLNVKAFGSYLFGGSKTDTPPLSGNIENIGTNGSPTSDYYQGDDFLANIRATKNLTVEYGVTADDSAFQKLIGAFSYLLRPDNTANLDQAAALTNEAVEELTNVRTRVGTSARTLEEANSTHDAVTLQLEQLLKDSIGTDITEATIKVSELELLLTATFQTFARVQKLSLTQYLG